MLEPDSVDLSAASVQTCELLAGCRIPQPHFSIRTSTGNQLAIRLPGDIEHMMRVPFEFLDQVSVRDVEQSNRHVGPACCQQPTVRTESDAKHGVAVSIRQLMHDPSASGFEDAHLP